MRVDGKSLGVLQLLTQPNQPAVFKGFLRLADKSGCYYDSMEFAKPVVDDGDDGGADAPHISPGKITATVHRVYRSDVPIPAAYYHNGADIDGAAVPSLPEGKKVGSGW